ncbi:MAG: hypothetical protein Q9226_002373 [Calogaya cf. arnoldii]
MVHEEHNDGGSAFCDDHYSHRAETQVFYVCRDFKKWGHDPVSLTTRCPSTMAPMPSSSTTSHSTPGNTPPDKCLSTDLPSPRILQHSRRVNAIPKKTVHPSKVSMLPALNVPDSQFMGRQNNYSLKCYDLFNLLALQINKLNPNPQNEVFPAPEDKEQCLLAADELEKLVQYCGVWEYAIEHYPCGK